MQIVVTMEELIGGYKAVVSSSNGVVALRAQGKTKGIARLNALVYALEVLAEELGEGRVKAADVFPLNVVDL